MFLSRRLVCRESLHWDRQEQRVSCRWKGCCYAFVARRSLSGKVVVDRCEFCSADGRQLPPASCFLSLGRGGRPGVFSDFYLGEASWPDSDLSF